MHGDSEKVKLTLSVVDSSKTKLIFRTITMIVSKQDRILADGVQVSDEQGEHRVMILDSQLHTVCESVVLPTLLINYGPTTGDYTCPVSDLSSWVSSEVSDVADGP